MCRRSASASVKPPLCAFSAGTAMRASLSPGATPPESCCRSAGSRARARCAARGRCPASRARRATSPPTAIAARPRGRAPRRPSPSGGAPASTTSRPRSRSGRHHQRQRADPVEEVLAELLLLDQPAEVLVRRRHQPHVDLAVAHVPEPPEAQVLHHLQQLRLHLQVHVADLVEEQRAAMGRSPAGPAWRRSPR